MIWMNLKFELFLKVYKFQSRLYSALLYIGEKQIANYY